MKYKFLSIILCSFILCSCGDNSKINSIIDSKESSSAETEALTDKEKETAELSAQNDGFDVDLTILNHSMAYSQVYDMVNNPDDYKGKYIKASGPFGYYHDDESDKDYFAVLIPDAAACCSQGIEFVLDGEYKYPDDYPETDTDITVTGYFNAYKDGNYTYCQLLNAKMQIN